MNKFECINAFLSVIDENGFAAAAKKLGISTPAVSRQINTLEQALNTTLIRRTTRRLSLTDVGMTYYEQCKKTLSALQSAEAAIMESQEEAIGQLKIISNHYFSEEFILPRLKDFMQQNPKVRIHFEVAERFPDLTEEGIDLIFGISLEGPPHLVRRQVYSTRYVLCASPAYLKQYGTPEKPKDLKQHAYITHTMRVPDNYIQFDDKHEIYLEPTLWLSDSRSMLQCALQGVGIVRLHDYMVNDAIHRKQLVELLPSYHHTIIPVFLYYQQSRYLQPKIRKFIDFFVN